jgi:hypothetical protein
VGDDTSARSVVILGRSTFWNRKNLIYRDNTGGLDRNSDFFDFDSSTS